MGKEAHTSPKDNCSKLPFILIELQIFSQEILTVIIILKEELIHQYRRIFLGLLQQNGTPFYPPDKASMTTEENALHPNPRDKLDLVSM